MNTEMLKSQIPIGKYILINEITIHLLTSMLIINYFFFNLSLFVYQYIWYTIEVLCQKQKRGTSNLSKLITYLLYH